MDRIKVFAGNAGRVLAAEVCRYADLQLGNARVTRFADDEVNAQLKEDVRGCDVFIINSLGAPAESWVEMALLCDAAHRSSAGRITLVPTYLGYNRQDRKDKPRMPVSAKVMISFIARQGADRALLFDIHSEPTQTLFDPLVVDHLYASIIGVPYLRERLGDTPFVVASPDKGGGPRAEKYAALLGQDDFALFSKSRGPDGSVRKDAIKIVGDVKGKNVLFVDDMIDTGGTVIADAEEAKAAGAHDIFVFATHALFSRGAVAKLDASPITEVIVTDTIHTEPAELKTKRVKIRVLSIAELLAKAIRRLHDNKSLSDLIL